MSNLALTYMEQGRWEEAEKLEVKAMKTRTTKLGEDHPDTLMSMSNLAFTWKNQGRHEDALSMMERCVQRRRQVLGLSHSLTKESMSTLDQWINN
jgi:DNA-binding ferritin-like protein (Dps family)